jgi:hypothetical protein
MSKAAMYPVLRNWSPESAALIARWQKALEEFRCLVEECRALVRERKRLLQASDDTRQPPATQVQRKKQGQHSAGPLASLPSGAPFCPTQEQTGL